MFRRRNGTGHAISPYRHIAMQSLVGLRYRKPPTGEKKFDVFCFCLNDKVCERHFATKTLEFGNDLGIVGYGNVCTRDQNCLYNAGRSHHRMTDLKKR